MAYKADLWPTRETFLKHTHIHKYTHTHESILSIQQIHWVKTVILCHKKLRQDEVDVLPSWGFAGRGLDIFSIYISNIFPFPGLPFRNPLSHLPSPSFMRVLPPTLLPSCPCIALHWGIKHTQA